MIKRSKKGIEKSKKFAEYKKSTPLQMSLFDLLNDEKDFSHTIELYDFMPKYFWGKAERIDGVYLPRLEREFECRSRKYTLTLFPASIEDSSGNEKYHYPAKREEIVEDALRKIMADGKGIFLDGEAGVSFSLYEVQKELSARSRCWRDWRRRLSFPDLPLQNHVPATPARIQTQVPFSKTSSLSYIRLRSRPNPRAAAIRWRRSFRRFPSISSRIAQTRIVHSNLYKTAFFS